MRLARMSFRYLGGSKVPVIMVFPGKCPASQRNLLRETISTEIPSFSWVMRRVIHSSSVTWNQTSSPISSNPQRISSGNKSIPARLPTHSSGLTGGLMPIIIAGTGSSRWPLRALTEAGLNKKKAARRKAGKEQQAM